jgi:hypothetical protein
VSVIVYGASDDLIEIEGSVQGCDEYNGDDEHFVLIGDEAKVRMRVWYTRRGVWAIAVAPVGEDIPMLEVQIAPADRGYTARAIVNGVRLVVHEKDSA